MKQLYKITVLIFVMIFMVSCIEEDEDVISTQDLLFGTWKTVELKENNQIQTLTECELEGVLEFSATDITFIDYFYDDNTSSCVFEEEYSFPYTFIEENMFKVYRTTGIINTEIVELNTTTLVLKSLVNDGALEKKETFERIN